MKVKLSKRTVESISPQAKDVIVWDIDLRGFGCKVTPMGSRTYFLYYRTGSGRERRPKIGSHGAITCDQARDIARQWLGLIAAGGDPAGERRSRRQGESVKEFGDRYFVDYAEGRKKQSTITTDRINFDNHIVPAIGSIKVSELGRSDVVRLHQSMVRTPGGANRTLALLSNMMNVAEQWGVRPEHSNPCRHVEKYPEVRRERFLTLTELATLGEVLDRVETDGSETRSVVAAIRLLILTGCRLSEILTLKWSYADVEAACLRLPDSKTGARVVILPAPALVVLNDIPRAKDSEWVITGRKPKHRLVNLRKPWLRIRAVACLDDVRLHDLRHSFASVAVSAELTMPLIGKLLGHTQTRTTERYAHLHDHPIRLAAERVGGILGGAIGIDGSKHEMLPSLKGHLVRR